MKKGYARAGAPPAAPAPAASTGVPAGGGTGGRMRGIWDRIEKGLEKHYPSIRKSLLPGATEAEIAEAEQKMGIRFPDEVRESFRIHDGQKDDAHGLADG